MANRMKMLGDVSVFVPRGYVPSMNPLGGDPSQHVLHIDNTWHGRSDDDDLINISLRFPSRATMMLFAESMLQYIAEEAE